jgi:CMP-2-keto-3-deoxyoctulosonic acid synthetase
MTTAEIIADSSKNKDEAMRASRFKATSRYNGLNGECVHTYADGSALYFSRSRWSVAYEEDELVWIHSGGRFEFEF